MDNILRKYQLLSECYDNECFKSKVYLEMVNQYPNMTLSYDDFSNMVYDVYNEFLQENIDYIESFCEANNNKAISKINKVKDYYNKLNDSEKKVAKKVGIAAGSALAAGGLTLAAASSKDRQEFLLFKQNTGEKCSFLDWVKMGKPIS